MELEAVIEDVKLIGSKLISRTNAIDCYLFGSILTNSKMANDIDILIIYENPNELTTIKNEFKIFASQNPLHIIYLTHSEEQELDFIEQQKAKRIFSL